MNELQNKLLNILMMLFVVIGTVLAMTDHYTLHGAGLAISAGILQYILLGRKSWKNYY